MTDCSRRPCLVCQQPLEWAQRRTFVEISSNERYDFFGLLLYCQRCRLHYFGEGLTYLSKNGEISQDALLNILPSQQNDSLQGSGKVHLITNPEPDWTVITPERRETPIIEILHLQIGANRLNNQTHAFLFDLCRICGSLIYFRKTMLLSISFLGYNNDPRPIWGIPEVLRWCYAFWFNCCDVACYMDVKGLYPFAIAVCAAMTNEYIQERVERNDTPLLNAHKDNPAALRFALFHTFSENILYGRFVAHSGKIKIFTHDQYEEWIKPFRERIRQLEEPVIRKVEKQLKARPAG